MLEESMKYLTKLLTVLPEGTLNALPCQSGPFHPLPSICLEIIVCSVNFSADQQCTLVTMVAKY